ncbi:MAG: DUF3037 domain-containing protein [Chlorobaculum sp.]|jgi:hypothetical protein|nr:DUF3037 domain-containing protein [Chlorobaculum sp.]
MKTYFTIVQYAPNPHREEYFGIGLIMVSPESGEVIVRFSRNRINRINNALNIRKSSLLESAIKKLELFEKAPKALDVKQLEYLSAYENGVIRFTHPKPLVFDVAAEASPSEVMAERFDRLYSKLIDDGHETRSRALRGQEPGTVFRKYAKKYRELGARLDICYKFASDGFEADTLIPDITVDFIGGNGAIYCGNFIDLKLQPATVQKNIAETQFLYKVLLSLFDGEREHMQPACKIIIDDSQLADKQAKQAMHSIERSVNGEPYTLQRVPDMKRYVESVYEEVKARNVEKFTSWIKKQQFKPIPENRQCSLDEF